MSGVRRAFSLAILQRLPISLNRVAGCADVCHKDEEFAAFVGLMSEALEKIQMQLAGYAGKRRLLEWLGLASDVVAPRRRLIATDPKSCAPRLDSRVLRWKANALAAYSCDPPALVAPCWASFRCRCRLRTEKLSPACRSALPPNVAQRARLGYSVHT
jgi:hypothetical protein